MKDIKFKKWLRWGIANGVFAVVIWLALVSEFPWAVSLCKFWVVLYAVLTLCVLLKLGDEKFLEKQRAANTGSVPLWFDNLHDLAIASWFAANAWYWAGGVYAFGIIVIRAVYDSSCDVKEKEAPAS